MVLHCLRLLLCVCPSCRLVFLDLGVMGGVAVMVMVGVSVDCRLHWLLDCHWSVELGQRLVDWY